jgi:hypothetical protein
MLEGLRGLEAEATTPAKRRAAAVEHLVDLYAAWGKPAQAAEWRARLAAPVQPNPGGM